MTIRSRHIIPGSIALDNERAMAEAVARRTAELRSSLITLGKEHNAFLTKCTGEAKRVTDDIQKLATIRDALKKELANIRSAYYDVKRVWVQGKKENDALREELAGSLRQSKMLEDARRNSAEAAAKLELGLKIRVKAVEDAIAVKEVEVKTREAAAMKAEKRNASEDKRLQGAISTLSEKERDYTTRVNALGVREKRAEETLAKEETIRQNEERVDIKAKTVQDKDKALQIERVAIARKRAYFRKKERGTK